MSAPIRFIFLLSALLVVAAGCMDFDGKQREFCQRNPVLCGEAAPEGTDGRDGGQVADSGGDAGQDFCGNGTVDVALGEVCDDGNVADEAECPYGTKTCLACNTTCSTVRDLRGRYCGDGFTNSASEACDDGNTVSETSCPQGTATCSRCSADCSSVLHLTEAICGDGSKHANEVCDDGNSLTEIMCLHGDARCTRCSADCSNVLSLAGPRHANPIAAKGDHSLALRVNGLVRGWGSNEYGQLGNGGGLVGQVAGLTNVTALAAGQLHTVALRQDGTVWAWGFNDYGQLGDGTTTSRLAPVQVAALTNAIALVAGAHHTVALRQDGTVWAWGFNDYGQLGEGGPTLQREVPVQVQGLTNVIALAAGSSHTLALREDGTVWAWGANSYGQLGDGMKISHSAPSPVLGLSNVTALVAGDRHTVALRQDGTVWAWGANLYGQLGNVGAKLEREFPVQVQGLTNITALAAGYHHTVALREDGTVWSWGYNNYGQLGEGQTVVVHQVPVQVRGLTNVIALAAGNVHTLALCQDGTVWAWGGNYYGQLGDGTAIQRTTPVQVQGLNN